MNLLEFLQGEPNGESWRFRLPRALHGAFGGVNGGVVAAVCLVAARSRAPGRVPMALDVRFLRGLASEGARVVPTVLHEGRTLSTVSVDVFDEREKLCTRGTVTLANSKALEAFDDDGQAGRPVGFLAYEQGRPWPQPKGPAGAPLVDTFGPRMVADDPAGIATAVKVLWEEPGTCAEASCIAADISVGPPVGRALRGRTIPIPNPDLSLRFAAEGKVPQWLVAQTRLERIQGGIALTRIEVRREAELVATGISTTTLLGGAWPDARR